MTLRIRDRINSRMGECDPMHGRRFVLGKARRTIPIRGAARLWEVCIRIDGPNEKHWWIHQVVFDDEVFEERKEK